MADGTDGRPLTSRLHTLAHMMLGCWVVLILALCTVARDTPIGSGKILRMERSIYRTLYVVEEGAYRCLTFGKADGRQSCVDPRDLDHLVFEYARATMAALYLVPKPRRILIVGLGGGVLPRAFQSIVPGVQVDAVEIDPGVVAAARSDFGYKESPGSRTYTQDARVFVRKRAAAGEHYDLIVLDAFDKEYIPEHLLTREFMAQVRSILAPGGVVAANTFARSGLRKHEQATYQAVFGPLMEVAVDSGNRILLARPDGLPKQDVIEARARAIDELMKDIGTGASFILPRLHRLPPSSARVLTDQYAPSNLLQVN